MACEYVANKPAFEVFVLSFLRNLRGKPVKREDKLADDLGMDRETVRVDGQECLRLTAVYHGCTVNYPSDADYDNCRTVGDLIDMLFTRIL